MGGFRIRWTDPLRVLHLIRRGRIIRLEIVGAVDGPGRHYVHRRGCDGPSMSSRPFPDRPWRWPATGQPSTEQKSSQAVELILREPGSAADLVDGEEPFEGGVYDGWCGALSVCP